MTIVVGYGDGYVGYGVAIIISIVIIGGMGKGSSVIAFGFEKEHVVNGRWAVRPIRLDYEMAQKRPFPNTCPNSIESWRIRRYDLLEDIPTSLKLTIRASDMRAC